MSDKLKKALLWTGAAMAILSFIVYVIVAAIMVLGFEQALDDDKRLIFTILGAVDGFLISTSLRSQGVSLASNLPENQIIIDEYNRLRAKTRKKHHFHKITFFIVISSIIDVIIKSGTVALSTWFVMYVFIEGNGDVSLILLAITNGIMFLGFGLVSMSKAYEFYNRQHISSLKEEIGFLKEKTIAGPLVVEQEKNGIL